MKALVPFFLCAALLLGDTPKPADVDTVKSQAALIQWLEQKLSLVELRAQAIQALYQAENQLRDLEAKKPTAPAAPSTPVK